MPGYGFSGPTVQPGFDSYRVADAIAELMEQLGYDSYIAQGGDWGGSVRLPRALVTAPAIWRFRARSL